MQVSIDELIILLLRLFDDGLTEGQEKRLYERIFSAKEASENGESRDNLPCAQSTER